MIKKKINVAITVIAFFMICSCSNEYTVNFWSDGEIVASVSVNEGKTVSDPGELKRKPEYAESFMYWGTKDGKEFIFITPINKNTDLYANWKVKNNYRAVTYYLGGDETFTDYVESYEYFTLRSFEKDGYILNGWYSSDDYYKPNDELLMQSDCLELNAYWIDSRLDGVFYVEDGKLKKKDSSVVAKMSIVQVPMVVENEFVYQIGSFETEDGYIKDHDIDTGFVQINDSYYGSSLLSKDREEVQYFPDIKEIVIPPSIVAIGYLTFCDSSIETVSFIEAESKFFDDLYICPLAFENCMNLQEVAFPSRLYWIGNDVFYGSTNLKRVFFPENLCYVFSHTFNYLSSDLIIYCEGDEAGSFWQDSWNLDKQVKFSISRQSFHSLQ